MTKEETIKLHKDRIDKLVMNIKNAECDIQETIQALFEYTQGPDWLAVETVDPNVIVDAGRTIANYQQYIKDAHDEIAKIEERLKQIDDLYFD